MKKILILFAVIMCGCAGQNLTGTAGPPQPPPPRACTDAEMAAGTSTSPCTPTPYQIENNDGGAGAASIEDLVFGAAWNGDTDGASKNVLFDYFDLFDTDNDGEVNVLDTDAVDAITEIASALKSGADGTLITGTAGTDTYTAVWNADGDLVDGYDPTTKQDVLAEGSFADGDKTKLNGIETSADVTDATNVAAAGALMDSGTDNIDDTHINWGAGAGQVDASDVPFADTDSNWTATNVGAALEEMDDVINGGVPNAATGKVDWSQLVNVPAGFADGTDATGAGGSAITFDIGDDGGDDSTDLSEIATTGDSNNVITLDAADKMLIDFGQNWPQADLADTVTVSDDEATDDAHEVVFTTDNATMESDGDLTYNPSSGTLAATEFSGGGANLTGVDAATGDSATAFFDAGVIEHERGGLEADISAYNGLIRINGGSTSNVTDAAGLETALGLGAYSSDILGSANEAGLIALLPNYVDQDVTSGSTPTFGDINLGVSTSLTGSIKLKNASNSYTLTIQPGATSQDWAITYPTAPPAGNDYAMVMSTGGVVSYVDTATLGGTPALNTVGDAAAQWTVASGTYQHQITMGTAGEWRWQVDGSNYISIINDGGVMRLKGVGTSTIDTGTVTLADEAVFGQTGTAGGDYFTFDAYDDDDLVQVPLIHIVAGNTVYGYLGGQTNGWQWDEAGALAPQGTASIIIPNGDDPDLDAVGKIALDTDGWLRVYNGSIQYGKPLQETIHVTVVAPNDLADGTRDAFAFWKNTSGMNFIVTHWYGESDTDNTTLNLEETDGDGANNATIDAVEIATNGTGMYYADDGTITGATIEDGHRLLIDFDDTDTPGQVKLTIVGYYDGNVN